MKLHIAVLAAAFVLAGCSKPTETVIPSDVAQWDKELAPAIKKLSPEDQKLVQGYLMRAKLSEVFSKGASGMPVGTTVGDAIAEQRKWMAEQEVRAAERLAKEAEEKALKERLLKEAEAARAQLNKAVTVALVAKSEEPANPRAGQYRARQTFTIGVTNNTHKRMTGVSGELEFVDLFGKVVGAVTFRIAEPIQPGFDVKWEGGRDYNEFIEPHRAVWNLSEGKYTTRFLPETILFEDGSKLTTEK